MSAVFHTAMTRRLPSGEITATMWRPSGDTETLLIAGRRANALASGATTASAAAWAGAMPNPATAVNPSAQSAISLILLIFISPIAVRFDFMVSQNSRVAQVGKAQRLRHQAVSKI
ncbi:hypothetical protein [Brevundimonas olei]|uniref:hypothetical protein n=1 Tax=Brevundimonas olei TaxID=657642 RepID=UPI0031D3F7B5